MKSGELSNPSTITQEINGNISFESNNTSLAGKEYFANVVKFKGVYGLYRECRKVNLEKVVGLIGGLESYFENI